jgi:hypothetical protein
MRGNQNIQFFLDSCRYLIGFWQLRQPFPQFWEYRFRSTRKEEIDSVLFCRNTDAPGEGQGRQSDMEAELFRVMVSIVFTPANRIQIAKTAGSPGYELSLISVTQGLEAPKAGIAGGATSSSRGGC